MNRIQIAALTVGLGLPAFALSRVIWPDPPGALAPPAGVLPFLIVPALFESLALGAGVAFLIAGGRALARIGQPRGLAVAAYISVGWALVSWWPHSNMHRVNTTLEGLAVIDWVFHITLITAASIVAIFAYRALTNPARPHIAGERHADAHILDARGA